MGLVGMLSKTPMPGYGIALIDVDEDDGEDRFDTPQVGELVIHNATSKDMKHFDFDKLINKKIYWQKYADADATFFDKDLGKDIVFIKLEKVVGYEE